MVSATGRTADNLRPMSLEQICPRDQNGSAVARSSLRSSTVCDQVPPVGHTDLLLESKGFRLLHSYPF